MNFISHTCSFDFQIISKFLNSRASTRVVYKACSNFLLARTFKFCNATNSLILAKIKFLRTFLTLQYY